MIVYAMSALSRKTQDGKEVYNTTVVLRHGVRDNPSRNLR